MTKKERLEIQEKLVKLRANGLTAEQISKELSVPVGTVRRWILKLKPTKPSKSEIYSSAMLELKRNGSTNKELSKKLGVSERMVVNYLSSMKHGGFEYINFHTGEIVKMKDIIPKDFQLFNFLKLSIGDDFDKIKFRNLFLSEDQFHKAGYFNKKDVVCIFSQEYYEYFSECLSLYIESGSLFRVKKNGMVSGVGFYGTDRWKEFKFNISSFIYNYHNAIINEEKDDFLSKYFEKATSQKDNGKMFYFYGCGIELYTYILNNDKSYALKSIPVLRKSMDSFPDKIYYVKKNLFGLEDRFQEEVLRQVKDGEAICSYI